MLGIIFIAEQYFVAVCQLFLHEYE